MYKIMYSQSLVCRFYLYIVKGNATFLHVFFNNWNGHLQNCLSILSCGHHHFLNDVIRLIPGLFTVCLFVCLFVLFPHCNLLIPDIPRVNRIVTVVTIRTINHMLCMFRRYDVTRFKMAVPGISPHSNKINNQKKLHKPSPILVIMCCLFLRMR